MVCWTHLEPVEILHSAAQRFSNAAQVEQRLKPNWVQQLFGEVAHRISTTVGGSIHTVTTWSGINMFTVLLQPDGTWIMFDIHLKMFCTCWNPSRTELDQESQPQSRCGSSHRNTWDQSHERSLTNNLCSFSMKCQCPCLLFCIAVIVPHTCPGIHSNAASWCILVKQRAH